MGSDTRRQLVLVGPFYTRREAVEHSGLSPGELLSHPGILRMGGSVALQEVYAAFQFGPNGLREDVAAVVSAFGAHEDPLVVCDWMNRPNPALGNKAPLRFLDEGGRLPRVVAAARGRG
jgi:hypothetical protein